MTRLLAFINLSKLQAVHKESFGLASYHTSFSSLSAVLLMIELIQKVRDFQRDFCNSNIKYLSGGRVHRSWPELKATFQTAGNRLCAGLVRKISITGFNLMQPIHVTAFAFIIDVSAFIQERVSSYHTIAADLFNPWLR